jgi:hypothetical protein
MRKQISKVLFFLVCLFISRPSLAASAEVKLEYWNGEIKKAFGPKAELVIENNNSSELRFSRALSSHCNSINQYAKSKKGLKLKEYVSKIVFRHSAKASNYGELKREGTALVFVANMEKFGVTNMGGPNIQDQIEKLYPEITANNDISSMQDDLKRFQKILKEESTLNIPYHADIDQLIRGLSVDQRRYLKDQMEAISSGIKACARYQNCVREIQAKKIQSILFTIGTKSDFSVQGSSLQAMIARSDLQKDWTTIGWLDKLKNFLKIQELGN